MARSLPALKMPRGESSERLMIEAAQRDPGRFAELYQENFERVYAYIARRVRDRDQAEDLTSDVFHQALAGIKRFQWRGAPFAAWLFRIAANAIVDHSRRSARDRTAAADDPPPARTLEEIEPRARLFRRVEGLPADQRRVITARFAEQKSIKEIAREMRRSEGAIKQLQLRGLQNLRARMGVKNG